MGFYDAIRVGASGAADSAYTVDRSLRFNDDDSAYLNRTPSSAGDRRTWTWSGWVKRTQSSTNQNLFSVREGSNARTILRISDGLDFLDDDTNFRLKTNAKFRDFSAWYHFVVVSNTTDSTSSNRLKVYVNGEQITSFSTETYPSQNYESQINTTNEHALGREGSSDNDYLDGYMAEVNFIDGQAYDPSYFGQTDATTGQWNPKKYVGSYGTNGFYLNFSDNSGTTATTLGKDSSGNGNNFTPNNFSVSAGAGNDSVEDTPTNNWCTLNPLAKSNSTLSNGNLKFEPNGNDATAWSTFAVNTGKWYWEVIKNSGDMAMYLSQDPRTNGFQPYNTTTGLEAQMYHPSYHLFRYNNNSTSFPNGFGEDDNGTVYGFLLDFDNSTFKIRRNNDTSTEASFTMPTALTARPLHVGYSVTYTWPSGSFDYRFGQNGFNYTIPTGHKALNSANLPDPTILLPNKHFDTLLYTGNGGTSQSVTGLQFAPDFVWIKGRSNTAWHRLQNSVIGANKLLYSNSTNAEATDEANGHVSSFSNNGFELADPGGNGAGVNGSGVTYVAWNWNAGDTDGKTYTVKVHVFSGNNRYIFDDFQTQAVTLDLAEGGTYIFDGSDSSMASHPIKLSETSNGTHGGGSSYNTGVTYLLDGASVTESAYVSGYSSATTRQLKIVVAASAPTLYYYCHYHSGMGGQVNTNTTLGSSNFDGSIQSVAKVNASAGFSITKYTGTGSAGATVGHGLGVAPNVIIIKNRTDSSSSFWAVYHSAAFNSASDPNILYLNSTDAQADDTNVFGTSVTINSTKFSLGDYNGTNGSSDNMISYCFSEVAGYSKFGSYVGNGSNSGGVPYDGPYVHLGFRPAWVMIKEVDDANNWIIMDNKRGAVNDDLGWLYPDLGYFEESGSGRKCDFLSNGFKIRSPGTGTNSSNDTYVYFAFAEAPFKNARAR